MTIRTLQQISQSIPTLEGAGVHLRRAFGFGGTALQLWFIEKEGRHKHGNSPTKPERSTTQRKIIKNKARSKKS